MAEKRLRIILEFNRDREDDVKLFKKLMRHSSPPAHIKDVLKGLVPADNQCEKVEDCAEPTNYDEDLCDF